MRRAEKDHHADLMQQAVGRITSLENRLAVAEGQVKVFEGCMLLLCSQPPSVGAGHDSLVRELQDAVEAVVNPGGDKGYADDKS